MSIRYDPLDYLVVSLHRRMGFQLPTRPVKLDKDVEQLLRNLILEEAEELKEAYDKEDTIGIADAIGDLRVVCSGFLIRHGIHPRTREEKMLEWFPETRKMDIPLGVNLIDRLASYTSKHLEMHYANTFSRESLANYLRGSIEDILFEAKALAKGEEICSPEGEVCWLRLKIAKLGIAFGFDLDKIDQAVYRSNASKTCSTKEDAEASVVACQLRGEDVYYKETLPGVFVIFRRSDNKFRKGIGFQEPDLSFINPLFKPFWKTP